MIPNQPTAHQRFGNHVKSIQGVLESDSVGVVEMRTAAKGLRDIAAQLDSVADPFRFCAMAAMKLRKYNDHIVNTYAVATQLILCPFVDERIRIATLKDTEAHFTHANFEGRLVLAKAFSRYIDRLAHLAIAPGVDEQSLIFDMYQKLSNVGISTINNKGLGRLDLMVALCPDKTSQFLASFIDRIVKHRDTQWSLNGSVARALTDLAENILSHSRTCETRDADVHVLATMLPLLAESASHKVRERIARELPSIHHILREYPDVVEMCDSLIESLEKDSIPTVAENVRIGKNIATKLPDFDVHNVDATHSKPSVSTPSDDR